MAIRGRSARGSRWAACPAALVLLAAACGDEEPVAPDGVVAADGLAVTVLLDGLDGPTQVALDDDGTPWLAALSGGEDEGRGTVTRYGASTEVVLEGLDKPTGLALTGDALWVMEERRLSRAARDGEEVDDLVVVRDELPYNGRSEGSLLALPDGSVLYDTSGGRIDDDGNAAEGSGQLRRHLPDPDDPAAGTDVVLAVGAKHAYAAMLVPDDPGQLVVTEMGDGRLDGERPFEELNAVALHAGAGRTADLGWPRCTADREPVVEHGGTAAACEATVRPVALFEPGASPTAIARNPFDPDEVLVGLWTQQRIVAVTPAAPGGDPADAEVRDWLTGVTPQQLLVDVDERVLVLDFTGRLLEVRES